MITSPISPPLKVGLLSYTIIACVCVIFFLGCSAGAYYARQYGPAAFFWVFILMGVYMLISAGAFELDEDGVSHKNMGGHYRMLWRDVQRIDVGTQGSLVLHGEGKRFVLPSPAVWSGPEKPEAFELLDRKLKDSGITPYPSNVADYKIHKNVKVQDAAV
jgi:hypothetical protein